MRIHEGDSYDMAAAMGSVAKTSTLDFIRDISDRFSERIRGTRVERLMSEVENLGRSMRLSTIIDRTRGLGRRMSNIWLDNSIVELRTIAELQHAPDVMIPLIMSDPKLKRLSLSNRIEGYADRYTDPQPNDIGWEDRNYRRLTTGIYMPDENGKSRARIAYENFGDDKLSFKEQFDAMLTIDRIRGMLASGNEDPTSGNNARL